MPGIDGGRCDSVCYLGSSVAAQTGWSCILESEWSLGLAAGAKNTHFAAAWKNPRVELEPTT